MFRFWFYFIFHSKYTNKLATVKFSATEKIGENLWLFHIQMKDGAHLSLYDWWIWSYMAIKNTTTIIHKKYILHTVQLQLPLNKVSSTSYTYRYRGHIWWSLYLRLCMLYFFNKSNLVSDTFSKEKENVERAKISMYMSTTSFGRHSLHINTKFKFVNFDVKNNNNNWFRFILSTKVNCMYCVLMRFDRIFPSTHREIEKFNFHGNIILMKKYYRITKKIVLREEKNCVKNYNFIDHHTLVCLSLTEFCFSVCVLFSLQFYILTSHRANCLISFNVVYKISTTEQWKI